MRHRNEILSAKVEVMDLFATVLFTAPAGGLMRGASPCVAHALEKAAADLEARKEPASIPAPMAAQAPSGPGADAPGYHGAAPSGLQDAEPWTAAPAIPQAMPVCPCCNSNARVMVSPNQERGRFFCPCNRPGPQYFDENGKGNPEKNEAAYLAEAVPAARVEGGAL